MAKKQTQLQTPPPEAVEEMENGDNPVSRIYLIKKMGVQLLDGPDARADIETIQKVTRDSDEGDTPFTFYEDGKPVYIAVKNGTLAALAFPEPGNDAAKGQIGMTSEKLYSLSVTLATEVEKIIELETEPKPSLIDQAKKIMTPTIAIMACVLVIFLMLAVMGG